MDHEIKNDGTLVLLKGRLTEESDFAPLLRQLKGTVTLNLAGMMRINSSGVRQWVNFMRDVPADVTVWLDKCPVAFVNQINMISTFLGHAVVRTMFVPCLCPKCESSQEVEVDVSSGKRPTLALPPCPDCGAPTEADVLEDEYFAFLSG